MTPRIYPESTVLSAINMYGSGKQIREIAKELAVHESTITRWITKYFFL